MQIKDLKLNDVVTVQYAAASELGQTFSTKVVEKVWFGIDPTTNVGRQNSWCVSYVDGGWDLACVIFEYHKPVNTTDYVRVFGSAPPKTDPKPHVWYRVDDETVNHPIHKVLILDKNRLYPAPVYDYLDGYLCFTASCSWFMVVELPSD